MDNVSFKDLAPIGVMITESLEKTSAEKAGTTLNMDAYTAGLEAGLGIEESAVHIAKTASCLAGREVMKDFIAGVFLTH